MVARILVPLFVFFGASHTLLAQEADAQADVSVSAEGQIEPSRVPLFPTSAFASRSQLAGAQLSPDGNRIASRGNLDGEDFVFLFDGSTGQPIGKMGVGEGQRVRWLRWAGNDKIVLSVAAFDEYNRYYSMVFVLDLAENNVFPIREKIGVRDQDNVIHIDESGSHILLMMPRRVGRAPTVFRYPLSEDGDREEVLDPKSGVWDWKVDSDGVVRIGIGFGRSKMQMYYRSTASDKLEVVEELRFEELRKPNGNFRYFEVLGVPAGTDIGYVLSEDQGGKIALRSYDFSQGNIVATIYEHERLDVNSVGFSRRGQPIWVSYTDDQTQVVWLDEGLRSLHGALSSALSEESIFIQSRSRDDRRMIIAAGGPNDPGGLYLFDQDKRSLEPIGDLKPGLDFRHLARPIAIDYTARDETRIRAYLTLPLGREPKNLPLVIMPHGGPYGARDSLRYDDWVQLLANRGYAVVQPNFRGSGGYGDEFFDLGIGEVGRGMQDDLDDAMDWLVQQGIADSDRVCIVGASYGGYAAIWGITRNPERYRCAASWAGVTDWETMLRYDKRFLGRQGSRRWRERIEGEDGFDLKNVSPLDRADDISRPLLLAHGTDDGIVNVEQYHLLRVALEKRNALLSTLLIDGEGHSFYDDGNEELWFDTLIDFLNVHNPADP